MTDLTSTDHWNSTWAGNIRMRLPSPWIVSARNVQRLIAPHVRPHDRVLEVGCAPGKMLAWIAAKLHAEVAGVDFSERGLSVARQLFDTLNLTADLRREDLRETTFPPASFDLVFSVGVIEHFDDPRDMVARHLHLVKPGGTALMTVPDYRGLYGTVQRHFNPEILLLHNLEIMTCDALLRLVPPDQGLRARAYRTGRPSLWQVTLESRWPRPLARAAYLLANAAALLQPVTIEVLCPMIALEVTKPTARG